jgi:hypothetical protein
MKKGNALIETDDRDLGKLKTTNIFDFYSVHEHSASRSETNHVSDDKKAEVQLQ